MKQNVFTAFDLIAKMRADIAGAVQEADRLDELMQHFATEKQMERIGPALEMYIASLSVLQEDIETLVVNDTHDTIGVER